MACHGSYLTGDTPEFRLFAANLIHNPLDFVCGHSPGEQVQQRFGVCTRMGDVV
jgi:hypothetical protein